MKEDSFIGFDMGEGDLCSTVLFKVEKGKVYAMYIGEKDKEIFDSLKEIKP